jgi:hypothetical protein
MTHDCFLAMFARTEVNMDMKNSSAGSAIGAITATFFGIVFFFAIIGVFGMEVSIAALLVFVALTLLIVRWPGPTSPENKS